MSTSSNSLRAIALLTLLGAAAAPAGGANVIFHLRADQGVQEAPGDAAENGDAVAVWDDQSTNGNDATLANALSDRATSSAPSFLTNQVNGLPALQFDATTERLAAADSVISGTMDYSIFSVVRKTGVNEHIFGANYGFGNSTGIEFYSYVNKLNIFKGAGGAVTSASTLNDGEWYLVYTDRDNSTATFSIRINDQFEGSNALTFGATGSLFKWYLGDGPDFNAVAGPNFQIAEQIIYDDNLIESERRSIALSLAGKYNLAAVPEPAGFPLALLCAGAPLLAGRRRG